MRFTIPIALGFALTPLSAAQTAQDSFTSAIEQYSELFLFRSLLAAAPNQFDEILAGKDGGITVLVPTNDAIASFMTESGVSDITDVKPEDLKTVLEYHVMDASLTSVDFDEPKGLTIPTRLSGAQFNNRTAGPAIKEKFGADAVGQVLFALRQQSSSRRVKSRQEFSGPLVKIRAGLAQDAGMTAIDGKWGPNDENSFQIIDKVLVPPQTCSVTVRKIGADRLSALDNALNKTEMWPTLNTAFNVTCLAPSTEAFTAAGNPQDSLNKTALTDALLFHTLSSVTYTNFLEDGMTISTLNDLTIKIRIKNGDIFFNNAKVIEPNVITNNGLIHILDAVMVASDETDENPSSTSSSAPSSTAGTEDNPSESPGAASTLSNIGAGLAAVVVAGFALM